VGLLNLQSTIYQQLILCSENDCKGNKRLRYISAIHKNAIVSIQSVFKHLEDAKENLLDEEAVKKHLSAVMSFDTSAVLTLEISQSIQSLWKDNEIKKTLYGLNAVDDSRLCLPSKEDILRCSNSVTRLLQSMGEQFGYWIPVVCERRRERNGLTNSKILISCSS
jgi:hypothetical protein